MEKKANKVKEHLLTKGNITSWEAIQLYRATRLSSIIFNMRAKGYIIDSKWEEGIDSNGEKSRYVRYILIGEVDMEGVDNE